MLAVESLGVVAGIGLVLLGIFGVLTMRSVLWRCPFAMFAVSGVLLSLNSVISVLKSLDMVSTALVPLEAAMMASFILVVMGMSLVLYVLARLYGNSTFSTVLVPKDSFTRIARRLEKMYGKTASKHIMYALGKDAEYGRAVEVKKRLGMDSKSLVRWLPDIFNLLGWAERTEVIEYVPKETLILRTVGNFQAQNAHCDGTASCDFLGGVIAGLSKALHPGRDCETVETKCQCLGHDYCEFEVNFFPMLRLGLVRTA